MHTHNMVVTTSKKLNKSSQVPKEMKSALPTNLITHVSSGCLFPAPLFLRRIHNLLHNKDHPASIVTRSSSNKQSSQLLSTSFQILLLQFIPFYTGPEKSMRDKNRSGVAS